MDVGEDFAFSYDTNLDILDSLNFDDPSKDSSDAATTDEGAELVQLWV
jgi:hypothetical protein